jgi:hypothetical protein
VSGTLEHRTTGGRIIHPDGIQVGQGRGGPRERDSKLTHAGKCGDNNGPPLALAPFSEAGPRRSNLTPETLLRVMQLPPSKGLLQSHQAANRN